MTSPAPMKPTARIPSIEPGTRPALAPIEARLMAARGRVSPLYRVLLNSAPVASGWEQLLTAIRQQTTVPPALRELAILRIAVLNRARFEYEAHIAHAQKAGLDDGLIEAVREPVLSPRFDDAQRLVLELTDCMTRDIEVPDALMARVKAVYDDRGLLELVATIAAYNMVSRLLVALHVDE